MLKIIIFVIPCILIVANILKKLFMSKKMIFGKRKKINQIGLRKQYLLTSIPSLLMSACFLVSINYVEYKYLWIVIAAINIIGVIFVTFYTPIDQIAARLQKEAEDTPEYKLIIKKEKRKIIFSIVILALWIHSWTKILF